MDVILFHVGLTDKIVVEALGPEPPCPRCKTTLKLVEEVVQEFCSKAEVRKVNILSPEVEKYGILTSPAVVVNGKVLVAGRVPMNQQVSNDLKELMKSADSR